MFREISEVLNEDVSLTGISLVQFRNILLHEMTTKRNKLTDFMASNKSMCLIKECREMARMNCQADSGRGRNKPESIGSSRIRRTGNNRIMRSFDTLDELESDITSSNAS